MFRFGIPRWLTFILIALLVIVVFTGTGLIVASRPSFCNSCHIMNPFYNSWKTSRHPQEAACLDCHADPGIIGEIRAHINGARYIYVLLVGRRKQGDYKFIRTTVPNLRCEVCHPVKKLTENKPLPHFPKHRLHNELGIECTGCHNDFIHQIRRGKGFKSYMACTDCHETTSPALNSCLRCHKPNKAFGKPGAK